MSFFPILELSTNKNMSLPGPEPSAQKHIATASMFFAPAGDLKHTCMYVLVGLFQFTTTRCDRLSTQKVAAQDDVFAASLVLTKTSSCMDVRPGEEHGKVHLVPTKPEDLQGMPRATDGYKSLSRCNSSSSSNIPHSSKAAPKWPMFSWQPTLFNKSRKSS